LLLLFIVFYLICFAYILNKGTELENSVHTELNNTIIEYCFKQQCGRRFTASMYNTIEKLNKILTSCDQLLLTDCGCAASRGLMLAIACGFLVKISYANKLFGTHARSDVRTDARTHRRITPKQNVSVEPIGDGQSLTNQCTEIISKHSTQNHYKIKAPRHVNV